MKLDIPTAILTAVIVAAVTFALTFVLMVSFVGDSTVTVEKIVEVERELTVSERRAIECYDLMRVYYDAPLASLQADAAFTKTWDAECWW